MRGAAIGLFLVTFAIAAVAIRVAAPTDATNLPSDLAGLGGSETAPTSPGSLVAHGDKKPEQQFELPANAQAITVLGATVSDRVRPCTRADILVLPCGKVPTGPPELALSGVFVIPVSTTNTVNEDNGEVVNPQEESLTFALNPEQIEKLNAAIERGKLLVVPAK